MSHNAAPCKNSLWGPPTWGLEPGAGAQLYFICSRRIRDALQLGCTSRVGRSCTVKLMYLHGIRKRRLAPNGAAAGKLSDKWHM